MTRALLSPLRLWSRFWFAPMSAGPIGAFRIAFGLIVLLNLALFVPDLDLWFTDAGYLRGTESRELAGPVWSARFNVPMRWSPLQLNRGPGTVRAVFGATALVAALFTLGWHTRVMSVLLYAGLLTIHHADFLTASGADVLITIVSFLLMFCPCGAAYSLDSRRRTKAIGGAYSALISPWVPRLIAIQISVVYFMTAVLKAQGKTWADGTALYYILNNGESRRFSLGLTGYPAAINAMTLGAVILEFALAFLLWVRAARPVMIALGVGLHGAICLTVNIPAFGELMAACYLCFLTSSEWAAIARAATFWKRREVGTRRATLPGRVDSAHSSPRGPHAPIGGREPSTTEESARSECAPSAEASA